MTVTNEQVRDALALTDAFDRAADVGAADELATAMAEVGMTDTAAAKELLVLGAQLQQARDYALDELAQVALGISLDEVRADRAAAYARISEEHLTEWAPEVASETTPEAVRAMLAYLRTEPSAVA